MDKRRVRMKALTQRAAHKKIAGVDDQRHKDHHKDAGVFRNHRNAAVFSGGGIVEKAHQKALKRRDACRVAGDTDAEADSKIAQRNGKTVAQTLAEFFPIHSSQTFSLYFPVIIAQLLT